MLRITADVFSGRPNPAWEATDEIEVRATLRELTADGGLLTGSEPAAAGLGFRGLRVEPLDDELGADFGLGASSYLPLGTASGGRSAELASRLIGLIGPEETGTAGVPDALPLGVSLSEFLTSQLAASQPSGRASLQDAPEAGRDEAAATCQYESATYNPGFWNDSAQVRYNNNCYNYATNWRTDTFAQPGRGCGHMYTAITCAEVTRAALCDGMHRRYDCFPESEKPRYLVAMVVIPGGGDYHWYRRLNSGWWAHKPGGTPVTDRDNSGALIADPRTADRGPYTTFCGYFYGCRSQQRRIR